MSARPIVLFVSNIPWDFVWQRHQTMASLFARDLDVVFCELPGIRRVGVRDLGRIWSRWRSLTNAGLARAVLPAGVRLARPWVLPSTNAMFDAVNARSLRRWLERERGLAGGVELIVNYSPARSARWLIEHVPHRHLVYDCTDDWLAVRGIPRCLPADERALLARADLTLVPSRTLEERKRPAARRLVRLPHGALIERFQVGPRARRPDEPLTVLYYGHIHAQHLDCAAIADLAAVRPDWRVILVGPVKTPWTFPSNVTLAGQQPHEKLREFISVADVLLLPYVVNDYTRAVLPAKIYECLATGRPIVAAPLPELEADFATALRFARQRDEWPGAIEGALRDFTAADAAENIRRAQANTWDARYAQLRALLAELPGRSA
jgi:glycosyltransferase involved in cell wall biosynthesis